MSGGITVLVVDDDPLNLRAVGRALRGTVDVVTATSGAEALALLRGGARVSGILSDYSMPGMDGLAFLTLARTEFPALRRVLVTAHVFVPAIVQAEEAGLVERVFIKPWDANELRAWVAALEPPP